MKLKDLELGSKVIFGKYQVEDETPEPISWLVIDKNHEGYPDNSCTLMSEYALDNLIFDASEPNNPNKWYTTGSSANNTRAGYGNRRWSVSNIRQWLNSDLKKEEWYTSQHEYDRSPTDINYKQRNYYYQNSFLFNFTKQEVDMLLDTSLITALSGADNLGIDNTIDKIFLPSITEIFEKLWDDKIKEGAYFNFFNTNSRIGYNVLNQQCRYWLRSCMNIDGTNGYGVNDTGNLAVTQCYATHSAWWVRPCCNLSLDTKVEQISSDTYKVKINKPKYILTRRTVK